MRLLETNKRHPLAAMIIILILRSSDTAAGTVSQEQSAWNGHTTPHATSLTPFRPYYVPPGSKSYDSSSPFVHYSGVWTDLFSTSFVAKSLRRTNKVGASAVFTFTGTGIEWFGTTSRRHGISDVYLDGRRVGSVDAWDDSSRKQQRLYWEFGLPHGKHTIKIVNTGRKRKGSLGTIMDIDAFVITRLPSASRSQVATSSSPRALPHINMLAISTTKKHEWSIHQEGSTGVNAMQLAIISNSHAIIIDKVEHNPLDIDGHPAWAALYNLNTHAVRPLHMKSNSFCAGGSFLSNGTLINVGGNPIVEDHTAAADFGDVDGTQGMRLFEPCDGRAAEGCEMYDEPTHLRMASPRWYATATRISDGSVMIIGGSNKGGWINNSTTNNPTIEYFPPKRIHGSNGAPIRVPFLLDTLPSNLFVISFSLPDGNVFIAANRDAIIYDWKANKELRLPRIPNGIRVTYPVAGTGLLLPLRHEDGYTPEMLLCGGSSLDDSRPSWEISSQEPASPQCSRLLLTEAGIKRGWEVEQMPEPRHMPDAVLLPTGEVVIVNGAGTGISGYGNVRNQVGNSNADHPLLTPVLYDPRGAAGSRFSSHGMPRSAIPRMYHSVATLTPSGSIMIAGSNPNLDRSEKSYGTEYRVEWLEPPYMKGPRPVITSTPGNILYGKTSQIAVSLSGLPGRKIEAALMDLGYVTHAVHANTRLVFIPCSRSHNDQAFFVTAPPNGGVYPPGPAFLFIIIDGVPSEGIKIMVGHGNSPPINSQ